MCMSKRPLSVKIVFALPLVVTLAWALLGAAQTNPFFEPLRAGQLMGMKVEDTDGQKIGTIRNLVLDTRTGNLKYAVIGSGGILGVHASLKLAPAQVLSAATAKRATLAIFATTERWKHAPVFKSSNLASFANPDRAQEISQYFEPSPTQASRAANNALSTTGHTSGQEAEGPPPVLRFASDLIGTRVVNQNQEKVGEILDLLVSFGRPRPAYAILSGGRFLRREQKYAVPLSALRPTDEGGKLQLNTDAGSLQQAPPFTRKIWDSRDTNRVDRIYRYSKTTD
jgi:sporulation protein YlmC with PRC-barrel domain